MAECSVLNMESITNPTKLKEQHRRWDGKNGGAEGGNRVLSFRQDTAVGVRVLHFLSQLF